MNTFKSNFIFASFLSALFFSPAELTYAQDKPKNTFTYVANGALVSPWKVVVGSPANWYVPLENSEGKTKDNNLKVALFKDPEKGEVINAKWSGKKGEASFAISNHSVDLSEFENNTALLIEMKIKGRIDSKLALSMDCEYPCRGTIQLRKTLKKYPKKQWFSFPVPLNCFAKNGTDLSKVNAPLHLQSSGKLNLSIANVSLALLPEGEKGCAE